MTHRSTSEPIVVVGGGLAGVAAALELRTLGYDGSLLLVTAETALPYRRSPLSKGYLRGDTSREALGIHPRETYRKAGIDLLLGSPATSVDAHARRLALRGHGQVPYRALIVATGTRPRAVPDREGVFVVHARRDADQLREAAARAQRAVVVGTGPTGREVARSLRELGVDVTVIDFGRRSPIVAPAPRHVAPTHVNAALGPRVLGAESLRSIQGTRRAQGVVTSSGRAIEADLVVLAAGTVAETLAASRLAEDRHERIQIVRGVGRRGSPAGDTAGADERAAARRGRIAAARVIGVVLLGSRRVLRACAAGDRPAATLSRT